jgi:hypothetical protein
VVVLVVVRAVREEPTSVVVVGIEVEVKVVLGLWVIWVEDLEVEVVGLCEL